MRSMPGPRLLSIECDFRFYRAENPGEDGRYRPFRLRLARCGNLSGRAFRSGDFVIAEGECAGNEE